MNDVTEVIEVPPLDRAAGIELFSHSAAERCRPVEPEAAVAAWAEAGGSPHWIKEIAAKAPGGGSIGGAEVEAAIASILRPEMRDQFLDEGWQHFQRRYPPTERRAAMAMFAGVCGAEGPVLRAELRNAGLAAGAELTFDAADELISRLTDAFYLSETPDGLVVRNPLLARWWRRYGRIG